MLPHLKLFFFECLHSSSLLLKCPHFYHIIYHIIIKIFILASITSYHPKLVNFCFLNFVCYMRMHTGSKYSGLFLIPCHYISASQTPVAFFYFYCFFFERPKIQEVDILKFQFK